MEWNRRLANLAPATTQNQPGLLTQTGPTVTNVQSQAAAGQKKHFFPPGQYAFNGPLIEGLLTARTADETRKATRAALTGNLRLQGQLPPNQGATNQYNSYKPVQETVQNSAGSNYRLPQYLNVVQQQQPLQQPQPVQAMQQYNAVQQQPLQQPQPVQAMQQYNAIQQQQPKPVQAMQQYNAIQQQQPQPVQAMQQYNAIQQQPLQQPQPVQAMQQYNAGYNVVQQPVQNPQTLQNYQPSVTYSYTQANMMQPAQNVYTTARQSANTVQNSCSQIAKGTSAVLYDILSGASGQLLPSQRTTDTNVSSTPIYRNGQNVTNAAVGNYMMSHFKVSKQPLTAPQMEGNGNYVQNPQRPVLQSFVNNSPQLLPTSASAAQMPPPVYPKPVVKLSDVYSQSQTYAVPNQPLPAQANVALPGQNSAAVEQAKINQIIATQERKRELYNLLRAYRNFKMNYQLLNRENNLLRERLKANPSLAANPPPLISTLPTLPNASGPEQQSQVIPVQGSPQISNIDGVQSQNVSGNLANAATQPNMQGASYPKENAGLSNKVCKTESMSPCRQNNYSVFDGGQKGVGNDSKASLQSLGQIYQEGTSRSQLVPANTNNQQVTSSNNNGNLSQNALSISASDFSTVFPEKTSNEYLPYCTSASREAIEASLPLWKTVPQSSTKNTGSSEPQNPVVDSTADTINLLDEITYTPTNEILPAQKPEATIPNQAKAQVAIVPPLVQTKEFLNESSQLPKAQLPGHVSENNTANGLTNPRDTVYFQKILEVLESIEANTMNNSKILKSKLPPDESPDDETLLSSIIGSSPQTVQKPCQDIEIVDDSLQISGICTLVEGNTLYDSSVAMMFESNKDDKPQIPNMPCNTPPNDADIKTEPPDDYEADLERKGEPLNDYEADLERKSEDPVHSAKSPDLIVQSNQSIETSELKSSAVSDQLSELLTEFPYGIKNYMCEIKLDDLDNQFGKFSDVPNFNIADVPTKEFEPCIDDHSGVCMDFQAESLPELQIDTVEAHLAVTDIETVDEKPPLDLLETYSSIPTSIPMDAEDDYCEIISDSPISDIQITLLDQEEITKIFPEHGKSISEVCSNIKVEENEQPVTTEDDNVIFNHGFDFKVEFTSPTSNQIEVTSPESLKDEFNLHGKQTVEFELLKSRQVELTVPESLKVEFNSHSSHKVELTTQNNHQVEFTSPDSHKVDFGLHGSTMVEFALPETHKIDSTSLEKENTNEKAVDVPDQTSFCCFLGWQNSTYRNAPKCNCKKESSKPDAKEDYKCDASPKVGTSSQSPEPIVASKPEVDFEESGVKPTDKPPELDLITPNAEVLQPMDKPPLLEPVIKSTVLQKLSHSLGIQEKSNLKRSFSLESIQSSKEVSVKSISSNSGLKEHTNKKHQDHHFFSKRRKSDGSQKPEKLVVKTDFLKNHHFHKPRKEDASQGVVLDQNRFQNVLSKTSFEAERRLQAEKADYRRVAQHQNADYTRVAERQSQPSEKETNRPKPFHPVEKSRHHRRGRRRKEKESHFEKNRKVPSVHEYLKRKREMYNKCSETRKDPNEGMSTTTQMFVERPSTDENKSDHLKRPYVKTNMTPKPKDAQSKSPKYTQSSKDYNPIGRSYDSSHRKHKNSHRQESGNPPSSNGKIYLSPCVDPKQHSDEQVNLVKLQIRRSPEKPKDIDRRKSVESSSSAAPSTVASTKSSQSPKMLEFKLCPEFAHGSPTVQDQSQVAGDLQAKIVVEGIKINKEAWCNPVPLKKRRVESSDSQVMNTSPILAKSPPTYKPLEKNAARPTQDSQTTFNLFKQMYHQHKQKYHQQRSKSLDTNLGHS